MIIKTASANNKVVHGFANELEDSFRFHRDNQERVRVFAPSLPHLKLELLGRSLNVSNKVHRPFGYGLIGFLQKKFNFTK